MGSAYSNGISLACLLKRVEKALFALAICGFAVAAVSPPSRADTSPGINPDAEALLARHKWAQAAVILRSEMRRDPRSISVSADLAKALLYLHHREEAIGVLDRAIELNRGKSKAWLIEQLRLVSKIFLTNTGFQTYQDGVDLLAAQRERGAQDKFEQALSAEPDNVGVLTRMGQARLLDRDYDGAFKNLKQALHLNPYEPEIHLWLGRAMELRGDKSEGLGELRQGAARLGQSELAPIWLAAALDSSGHADAAMKVLDQDIKSNPIHVDALVELAKLKIRDPDASQDILWSARRDFQNALSRLVDYEQPGRRRFEGELGIEIFPSDKNLHDEIQSQLQKLESRLEADSSR